MEKKKLHSSVKKLMTVILRSGVFMQIDVLFVISSCYLYTYIYETSSLKERVVHFE